MSDTHRETEQRDLREHNLEWVASLISCPNRGLTARHYLLRDHTIPIDRPPGNGDGDTILIADPAISRARVSLERSPAGVYRIIDRGSRNPTRINGRTVKEALLDANTVVRVGNSLLVVDLADSARAYRRRTQGAPTVTALLEALALHQSTEAGVFAAAAAFIDPTMYCVAVTCDQALEVRLVADWLAERWGVGLVAIDAGTGGVADRVRDLPVGTAVLVERVEVAPDPEIAALAEVFHARSTTEPVSPVVFSTGILERRLRPALVNKLFSFNAKATLRVPGLTERRADIIEGILFEMRRTADLGRVDFPAAVCERLLCYDWPGGLAELRREAGRLRAMVTSGAGIDEGLLSEGPRTLAVERNPQEGAPRITIESILRLLDETGGKMTGVARRFGYSRSYFYQVLREHGLDPTEIRSAWRDRNNQS